jgi:hypothetical protein
MLGAHSAIFRRFTALRTSWYPNPLRGNLHIKLQEESNNVGSSLDRQSVEIPVTSNVWFGAWKVNIPNL